MRQDSRQEASYKNSRKDVVVIKNGKDFSIGKVSQCFRIAFPSLRNFFFSQQACVHFPSPFGPERGSKAMNLLSFSTMSLTCIFDPGDVSAFPFSGMGLIFDPGHVVKSKMLDPVLRVMLIFQNPAKMIVFGWRFPIFSTKASHRSVPRALRTTALSPFRSYCMHIRCHDS